MPSALKIIRDFISTAILIPAGILIFVCIVLISVTRVLIQFSIAVVSDLTACVSSFPDKEK